MAERLGSRATCAALVLTTPRHVLNGGPVYERAAVRAARYGSGFVWHRLPG
jgi:hypothetical protein